MIFSVFTRFLAIFGLKNSRMWPESARGVQNCLYDLGYPIRCPKKIWVMLREVKGTFPKKVDPHETFILRGGEGLKSV